MRLLSIVIRFNIDTHMISSDETGEIDERATARGLSEALEKLRIEKFSPSEKFISSCRDVICRIRARSLSWMKIDSYRKIIEINR